MKKFTLTLKISLSMLLCLSLLSFSLFNDLLEDTAYLQNKLKEHHNEKAAKQSIKRFELNITNSGFCRYKRYYSTGKTEFFSFNIAKYKGMDYYGNDKSGNLVLHTLGEDVIVQTHNDRKQGDIDSMSSYLRIPLKSIEPEQLVELSDRLSKLSAQLLVQK